VQVGAPDPTLMAVSGMLAVTELCERLDVIGRLDTAIGSIKQRRRGHSAGEVLVGIAAAQMAGEDFLVGLDRRRAEPPASSWRRCRVWRRPPRPGWPAGSPTGSGRRWRPGSATSRRRR
jgi:hypothetical protein